MGNRPFPHVFLHFFKNFLQQIVHILDPSELHRPEDVTFAEKSLDRFRDYTVYENDPISERVLQTYKQMHQNQTVDFVRGKYRFGYVSFPIIQPKRQPIKNSNRWNAYHLIR